MWSNKSKTQSLQLCTITEMLSKKKKYMQKRMCQQKIEDG